HDRLLTTGDLTSTQQVHHSGHHQVIVFRSDHGLYGGNQVIQRRCDACRGFRLRHHSSRRRPPLREVTHRGHAVFSFPINGGRCRRLTRALRVAQAHLLYLPFPLSSGFHACAVVPLWSLSCWSGVEHGCARAATHGRVRRPSRLHRGAVGVSVT